MGRDPVILYVVYGGKWTTDHEGKYVYSGSGKNITSLFWDVANLDFDAFLKAIIQKLGCDMKNQRPKIAFQIQRLEKNIPPFSIDSSETLHVFLLELKQNFTALHVEMVPVEREEKEQEEQIHEVQEELLGLQSAIDPFVPLIDCFQDDFFNCTIVADQESGRDQEGIVFQKNAGRCDQNPQFVESNATPVKSPTTAQVDEDDYIGGDNDELNEDECFIRRDDPSFDTSFGNEVDATLDGGFEDGSDLAIGLEFANKRELKKKMVDVSIQGHFETKTVKSDKKSPASNFTHSLLETLLVLHPISFLLFFIQKPSIDFERGERGHPSNLHHTSKGSSPNLGTLVTRRKYLMDSWILSCSFSMIAPSKAFFTDVAFSMTSVWSLV
ncbi:unnamed protein product [Cuscuta campestris]|uniref:Uncharacterized protein n=1 Tax=Cuscuta campestris TaxID=132261 RepID=A0A484LJQ6_9ASTE|nr:unnamed protein product [Cuscuta campestris]